MLTPAWQRRLRALRLANVVDAAAAAAAEPTQGDDPALVARARAIHERAISIDTHIDINPNNFTAEGPNYADRLESQVNLPKMEEGGLDAVFLVACETRPHPTPPLLLPGCSLLEGCQTWASSRTSAPRASPRRTTR